MGGILADGGGFEKAYDPFEFSYDPFEFSMGEF
jgi:hypothetical protein